MNDERRSDELKTTLELTGRGRMHTSCDEERNLRGALSRAPLR